MLTMAGLTPRPRNTAGDKKGQRGRKEQENGSRTDSFFCPSGWLQGDWLSHSRSVSSAKAHKMPDCSTRDVPQRCQISLRSMGDQQHIILKVMDTATHQL